MNEFADANPQSWLDESHVLLVRPTPAMNVGRVRGLASEVRSLLSTALFGLSVAGLMSFSASMSNQTVRSAQVMNEHADNGLTRRYWAGLASALDQAPEMAIYEESDEVAPLL